MEFLLLWKYLLHPLKHIHVLHVSMHLKLDCYLPNFNVDIDTLRLRQNYTDTGSQVLVQIMAWCWVSHIVHWCMIVSLGLNISLWKWKPISPRHLKKLHLASVILFGLDTHDSLYEYIYNCVFGSLISDVTCNYVSADGGRDGLWWPALPGHWLSYTGCWLSLLVIPPKQRSCWGVYWFHSVRLSVRLSVRPSVPAAVSAL